jgi:hypothetical protein
MTHVSAIPAEDVSVATFHPAALRLRCAAESYVAELKAKLSITEGQIEAWSEFAEALSANGRRMQSVDDGDRDQPFGPLQDRLAALGSMWHAAAELFAVLGTSQQLRAVQLLPLCCLPRTATH